MGAEETTSATAGTPFAISCGRTRACTCAGELLSRAIMAADDGSRQSRMCARGIGTRTEAAISTRTKLFEQSSGHQELPNKIYLVMSFYQFGNRPLQHPAVVLPCALYSRDVWPAAAADKAFKFE